VVVGGAVVGAVVVGGAVVGAVLVGGAVVGALLVGGAVVGALVGGAVVGALLLGFTVAGCELVAATGSKPPAPAGARSEAEEEGLREEEWDGTTLSALAEALDAVGTCVAPAGDGPLWEEL
jgi:hypothetical protein